MPDETRALLWWLAAGLFVGAAGALIVVAAAVFVYSLATLAGVPALAGVGAAMGLAWALWERRR